MGSRRLSLHVSALNEDEYTLYNGALVDLALDSTIQNPTVGVREVRAWMRGRFNSLSVNDVDTILKFFSPTLAPADTLSAGQFFAAVRLAVHVDGGEDVDKALAFVQARPKSPTNRSRSPSRAPSPPKRHPPPPQRSQSQRIPSTHAHRPKSNPFAPASLSSTSIPPLLPPRKTNPPPPPPPAPSSQMSGFTSASRSATPHLTTNLMKQSLQASKTGQTMKNAEKMLEKERIMQVLKSSSPGAHASSSDPSWRAPSPTKSLSTATSSSHNRESVAPPLPSRKRLIDNADVVSHSSLEQVAAASLSSISKPPPPPPLKPPFLSSNPATRIPVSSGSSSSSSRSPSSPASGGFPVGELSQPPPTHPDRLRRRGASSSTSISAAYSRHSPSASLDASPRNKDTFEAIYGPPPATAPLHLRGLGTPSRPGGDPTSPSSPSPRMFRSKSLHVSSSPTSANATPSRSVSQRKPPVPPPLSATSTPSKRRPETMHFLPSPRDGEFGTRAGEASSPSAAKLAALRKLKTRGERSPESARVYHDTSQDEGPFSDTPSFSRLGSSITPRSASGVSSGSGSGSMGMGAMSAFGGTAESHIQKTLNKLTLAKYKAEAGLMGKRGFVPSHGDGLVSSNAHRDGWERERQEKQGLMADGEFGELGEGYSPFSPPGSLNRRRGSAGAALMAGGIDSGDESDGGDEDVRGRRRGVERDSMKWPVQPGEGWTAL